MDTISHVGLDLHKATACVAPAKSDRRGEVAKSGVFDNRPEILRNLAKGPDRKRQWRG